jgi:hypothetical protein
MRLHIRDVGLLVFVVACAVTSCVSAQEAAFDTLRRYSAALLAADCDTVYSLTSNAVRRRDKYPGEWRHQVCPQITEWRRAGMAETLGKPTASFASGSMRAVFVPTERTTRPGSNIVGTDVVYVVHSDDGGKTWRVLDLGCLDERWIKEVYPAYDGNPPIHATK